MIQVHLKMVHEIPIQTMKVRNLSRPVYSSITVTAEKAQLPDNCLVGLVVFFFFLDIVCFWLTKCNVNINSCNISFGANQLEIQLGRKIPQRIGVGF